MPRTGTGARHLPIRRKIPYSARAEHSEAEVTGSCSPADQRTVAGIARCSSPTFPGVRGPSVQQPSTVREVAHPTMNTISASWSQDDVDGSTSASGGASTGMDGQIDSTRADKE